MPDHGDIYSAARKRVRAKKEFYKHVVIFGVFHILLFILNMIVAPGRWWFLISFFGWGIFGLLIHYLTAIGIPGVSLFDKQWEDEEIRREADKLQRVDRSSVKIDTDDPAPERLKLKELREEKKRWR